MSGYDIGKRIGRDVELLSHAQAIAYGALAYIVESPDEAVETATRALDHMAKAFEEAS